jgi:hypothetical protein
MAKALKSFCLKYSVKNIILLMYNKNNDIDQYYFNTKLKYDLKVMCLRKYYRYI